MVLGEVAGGFAASGFGLSNLWKYNRDNFLYDRKMRLETELKVAEWRAEQANQWREDVRDLTGLTEQKMQSYMMVNTLQLSMCVVLYTEGRLQPGTPHWLLHLYMLTLSASFMYLLMSVWLAMHASVVVACEKARLLTQFVRLPVPTWRQFEKMRTAAASYETLTKAAPCRGLRVPFMDTVLEKKFQSDASSSSGCHAKHDGMHDNPVCGTKGTMPMNAQGDNRVEDHKSLNHGAPSGYNDTWGLETQGDQVEELSQRPLHSNRHINLVRRAQTHYQCHDAFARISMSFGTNQLLLALSYFVIGYVSVGDGAPWPAIIISAIMVSIAIALVQLDISFTPSQHLQAFLLMTAAPALTAMSVIAWCMNDHETWQVVPQILLPPAYVSHGLWLLWALRACQVRLHPGGEMLPTKYRMTLYLDVFGWIHHQQQQHGKDQCHSPPGTDGGYKVMVKDGQGRYASVGDPVQASPEPSGPDNPLSCRVLSREITERNLRERARLVAAIHFALEPLQTDEAVQKLGDLTKKRVENLQQRLKTLGEELSEPIQHFMHVEKMVGGSAHDALPSFLSPPASPEHGNNDETEREIACNEEGAGTFCCPEVPGQSQEKPTEWLKAYHCTDFGTEVPYEYHPQTGKVRHARSMSAESSPRSIFQPPLDIDTLLQSLSDAESHMNELEKLEAYHEKAAEWEVDPFEKIPTHKSKVESDLSPRALVQRARGIWASAKKGTKHSAAEAAPWLFADIDEAGTTGASSQEFRNSHNRDCPDEILLNTKGIREPAHDPGDELDNSEIIMAMGPDKLPWQVFRHATLLLVFLWLIGPFQLYGWYPCGRSEFGPQPPMDLGAKEKSRHKSFAEEEDPDGTFSGMVIDNRDMDYDLEPTIEDYESMPTLPPGLALEVRWPFESTFTPRALTTDSTGKHLVVSEDFGIYFGQIANGRIHVEDTNFFGSPENAKEGESRRLRGRVGELKGSGASAAAVEAQGAEMPSDFMSFMHMPHCTALEGKQLKDIGIVCSKAEADRPQCRVLVLHSSGRRLTECPLYSPWGTDSPVAPKSLSSSPSDSEDDVPIVQPLSDWKIAGSWLDHNKESVESLAVDPECEQGQESAAQHVFDPAEIGCVVVGTSSGRVVQLRRHVSKKHELVPEWAMQERRGKVAQGSLQVFPGGFVIMLRSEIGVMQAINVEKGTILGQWRLPDSADWFSISGGGASLFMMGYEKTTGVIKDADRRVTLWKFPLPPALEKLFAAYPGKDRLKAADE